LKKAMFSAKTFAGIEAQDFFEIRRGDSSGGFAALAVDACQSNGFPR
jgi:hypothetical protein